MFIGACGLSNRHRGERQRWEEGGLWTEVGNKANLAWIPPPQGACHPGLHPGREVVEQAGKEARGFGR